VTLTLSRSGIAAMLFALMVLAIVTMRRQKGIARRTLVTTFVILLVIAIPAWAGADRIASHFAEIDWRLNNRWGAWLDAIAVASRFPLTGTGLNTYSVAMISYQHHDMGHFYNAAHNDYLQLAAEGGLLLTVPALLCVIAFVRLVWLRFKQETSTSGYWLRVGAVTGLCAVALQETVDFSLQMPGNAVLFALLCGIALHRSRDRASV
jgi:O-antigen ligase